MDKTTNKLTVLDGLTAYARTINTLDIRHLEPLLAEDFSYTSQWVMDELTSKDAFVSYLTKKLDAIRRSGDLVFAELAECPIEGPCVVVAQGSKDNAGGTVIGSVRNGKLTSLAMCAVPTPESTVRSGIDPS